MRPVVCVRFWPSWAAVHRKLVATKRSSRAAPGQAFRGRRDRPLVAGSGRTNRLVF